VTLFGLLRVSRIRGFGIPLIFLFLPRGEGLPFLILLGGKFVVFALVSLVEMGIAGVGSRCMLCGWKFLDVTVRRGSTRFRTGRFRMPCLRMTCLGMTRLRMTGFRVTHGSVILAARARRV